MRTVPTLVMRDEVPSGTVVIVNEDRASIVLPGGDPAVLLVHGFTGTPWEVRPIAEALRAAGHACLAPLLPGHGTVPEALAAVRWHDWAACVDRALESLLETHASVVLVGGSLGGLLVLDAAARHPKAPIGGVVTLGVALQLDVVSQRAVEIAEALGTRLPNVFIAKHGGSDIHDPIAKRANPAYSTQPMRAAREFVVGQRAVRRVLSNLSVPILAMHGLRDSTARVESSLEVVRSAGSEEASLVLFPNSAHVLGVDYDHREVAAQTCAFVDRNRPQSTA